MVPAEIMPVGKLPAELLQRLLARYGGHDARLVVGPRVGEDAAVLDLGERYLVVKSDPITFATDEIGWYVVSINANDIATMGATPRWFLLTLLLPEGQTDWELVDRIFEQVDQACQALSVVLCGGHTEITAGVERPLAVGVMLGEVEKADLVQTAGAQPGDEIVLTKGIAIEGTAVLAREMGGWLADQVGQEVVARGRRFLHEPGISVVRDAEIVRQAGQPHAMHDPTEGGLATGLGELAQASGHGIVVDLAKVYRFPETVAFCQALDLDPLGLLGSGALLVTASPVDARQMVEALEVAGIGATVIGQVLDGPPLVYAMTASGVVPFPAFARDELARLFERGTKAQAKR
ncbi:MAG: hydrogenase expression protein [Anaerolineae bacterium]|nr:hydrogenase expression protein [Anaerolineae bacterium]